MKVAVVGGGPAGLYFAYLARIRGIAREVVVYERSRADATWGFGIALSGKVLRRLERTDARSFRLLSEALHWVNGQSFTVNGTEVPIDRADATGAIERLTLLRILQGLCTGAGVVMRFEHPVEPDEVPALQGDLVIGADGANSVVRRTFAPEFGVESSMRTNRFCWYGVGKAFEVSSLNFKTLADDRGALVGHYYPYAPAKSTFVMECDEYTWFTLGLDVMSDEQRGQVTQQFYSGELGGLPLISNNSVWRQFNAAWTRNWHYGGRYVLLGDALRVAHPSIGSGTRLAMEDAIALCDALQAHPGAPRVALKSFVAMRSPGRNALAAAAEHSFTWYEGFRERICGRHAIDVARDFLTRTGMLDEERLRKYYPRFMEAYAQARAHAGAPRS